MLKNYLANINFDWPWMFVLFGILPILAVYFFKKEKKLLPTFTVSGVKKVADINSWKVQLRNLPIWLRLFAFASLIVALARPAKYQNIEITNGEGIDIMLCMDVSGSMLARDFTPDRLQASLQVAKNFVENRKGDRIGLVIFAGQSLSICPLTTDHRVVIQQLDAISYGGLADGTAIGSGLASAVDRLRTGTAKSKVILLLTDGENTGGFIDPETAKQLAMTFAMRVYTIGVGTIGTAPMPYKTPNGETIMQSEKVSIDEPLLTDIAQKTGGKYFRATNNLALDSIYQSINYLEKSKVETSVFRKRTDEFFSLGNAGNTAAFGRTNTKKHLVKKISITNILTNLCQSNLLSVMKALIYRSTGTWYDVADEENKTWKARIKGALRLDGITSTNPIAVGDLVEMEVENEQENTATIQSIYPRTNYISRQSPHNKNLHHIIAANLSQSILLVTIKDPRTSQGFIDRFLAASEAYYVPSILVFNKIDGWGKKEWEQYEKWKKMYEAIGYTVMAISVQTGENMELLKAMLANKTTLISGHSGVGKSSFLNTCIAKDIAQSTATISNWSGKGMHTTTFAQMFNLPDGGKVIDTPGVREFGLVHIRRNELSQYFREMRVLLPNCRFNNCLHIAEPGCAVKAAISNLTDTTENASMQVHEDRYLSYLSIIDTIEEKYGD